MNKSTINWILETRNSAYCFGINDDGYLINSYWGKRKNEKTDYPLPLQKAGWASFDSPVNVLPEEYPVYGGAFYHEPCLKIKFADGVRDLVLVYDSDWSSQNEIRIKLRDTYYPLQVILHYKTHANYDLIERWVEVINKGKEALTIERIFSAQWHFPEQQQYYLSHLSGKWGDEFHLIREALTSGVKVLESRRITSSHHHNPWFMIDAGNGTETEGEVWFGALAWSGNWKLAAEVTNFDRLRISMGINDWDFAWKLDGEEKLITPSAFAGYTQGGFGQASRSLHNFIREQVIPHGANPHKILYNSWEATLFDVDEISQTRLAKIAASMGVELFVLDDGWFYKRNSDHAGLGDWWPDPVKFPYGLQPLIQKVNQLGMDFGLWIEPEMVNPDSDLYRAHPDWILHFPTRERTLARNQCILNMALPEVQEYLIEKMDHLLKENNIAFIKWDMNRNVSEPGWLHAPGDPKEIWVRYVQGLSRVWGELRLRHPDVIWQSCSGGGGRADVGILHLADQIWVSDNTKALDRLQIQHGFSMAYPAIIMEAWVTDADRGTLPLSFRFHVSMCGSLGIGGNLLNWSEEERNEAAYWISHYKSLREIIQLGDQYRLGYYATQYMSKDFQQGVLFVFNIGQPVQATSVKVRLQGLRPDAIYEIEGLNEVKSGLGWMSEDLVFPLELNESTVREIHQKTNK
jgi:alpha-galactosidase